MTPVLGIVIVLAGRRALLLIRALAHRTRPDAGSGSPARCYLQKKGSNMDASQAAKISSRYIRFADEEVRGRSPLYETLARSVADDAAVIDFLSTLPAEKQQPNLLFAAVRFLFGTPGDWIDFRRRLLADPEAVRAVMLIRSTQTNEPARCATLLPVFARLPPPLALIEIGASAGLCLLPDCYGYDYGDKHLRPQSPIADLPVFACSISETTPLPAAIPEVVWRAGLDLNPLDLSDPTEVAWLEALVWPEQTERLYHLRGAMKVAAAMKPRVVKGTLLGDDLAKLCREVPAEATLVVFHTAVLAYVPDHGERGAFARRVMALCRYWVSNESPRVFPDIARRAKAGSMPGGFLMSVNGSPVAWTEPHGASMEWIGGAEGALGRDGADP